MSFTLLVLFQAIIAACVLSTYLCAQSVTQFVYIILVPNHFPLQLGNSNCYELVKL
uniref:Uncharacterized protein n=1 Tax=Arundo donax TaxID=35708 RepID=A0A0A9A7R8_ARUDO